MFAVVGTRVVQSCERGRGDGGSRRAAVARAIRNAAVGILATVDVLLCVLNDFERDGDAGISASTQPLNLSYRG